MFSLMFGFDVVKLQKLITVGNDLLQNYKRVIETWFDEKHKEFFYTREPLARFLDMGDISEQVALKEKLQCKDFQWYMDNVAYDVYEKFPELPPNLHWGEVSFVQREACRKTRHRQSEKCMATDRSVTGKKWLQ